jgi:hypothetical protein
MKLDKDVPRGKELAKLLYDSFSHGGIHGNTVMPEDILPPGVKRGSLEHLLFITLTVAIDYQRDATALWEAARKSYSDGETSYLFKPQAVHETNSKKIIEDMKKHSLSQKPKKDAYIWRTVGVSFHKKWGGDPRNFLADCNFDALDILRRLKTDTHSRAGREVADFPYLRGDKIGPLWLRILRDNIGISGIKRLQEVPIPVDVHVARASLAIGVVRGSFSGKLVDLFPTIREAWFASVRGLSANGREMIALDVDEPLWHLSKFGCTKRNKVERKCPFHDSCEVKEYCVEGKIALEKDRLELET